MTVPVDYLLSRGQQIKVFSVILHKARELGFVCPDDKKIGTEGKYEGATVLEAARGAYFDVVSGLDFASLVSPKLFVPLVVSHMPKSLATASQPWHFHMLGGLLLYNLVVFLVFLPVYLLLDFNKHFYSENKDSTLGDKLYFCLMTHSNAMAGDYVPKTEAIRRVMSLHILFTWMQLLFIFYTAPPSSTSGRATVLAAAAKRANVIVAKANTFAKAVVKK